MKLAAILLSSLDGVSNQGGDEDHHEWSSAEDWDFFNQARDNARLIIMGSRTYKAAKSYMVHQKDRLRVILTHTPDGYQSESIPGKLEFTNERPRDLIKRLEAKGINEGIIVGGAHTTTGFLKENLISEIWITIEPWIKGEGLHMVTEKMDIPLRLIETQKLNEKGTLLLKYSVVKAS